MAVWDKPKVLAVGGPTASGKTAFSIALAKALDGEIICADSMQLYKGLTIGTAKVTKQEAQGIPHHLVDLLSPEQSFSVADYITAASRCIDDITARGKLPILVGGTGQYIESLLCGMKLSPHKSDLALRDKLSDEAKALGNDVMHQRLAEIDPDYAAKVHPNNLGRVLRALELYYSAGITMTQQRLQSIPSEKPYQSLVFCLNWPDRTELYQRINTRVDQMLSQGVLAEAQLVFANRKAYTTAAQAIGYKEFFPFFEGTQPLEPCVEKLKQASRNYAKRQLTWFKRMEDVIWLDACDPQVISQALAHVSATFL